MNDKLRRTDDYLSHILQAIRRIRSYVAERNRAAFENDTRTQDAVIRNLEVIGEAARNILQRDPGFATAHPEIPWTLAYRMRNALSHGYADIDLGTVWTTATTNLPLLERQLLALLRQG